MKWAIIDQILSDEKNNLKELPLLFEIIRENFIKDHFTLILVSIRKKVTSTLERILETPEIEELFKQNNDCLKQVV